MNTDQLLNDSFMEIRTKLIHKANSILNNWADAEDMVHDVFLKVWEMRSKIKINNLKGYLWRSVIFECQIQINHQKVIRRMYQGYITTQDKYELPAQKMENKELQTLLINAIEYLSPMARRDFVNLYLQGKKQREVAAKYNISLQVVKNRIPKTLDKLRTRLKIAR